MPNTPSLKAKVRAIEKWQRELDNFVPPMHPRMRIELEGFISKLIRQSKEEGRKSVGRCCSVCRKVLLLSEFPRDTTNKSGFKTVCRFCYRLIAKNSYYRHLENNRKMKVISNKKALKLYPEKVNARKLLRYAIRLGLLKQRPCAICGSVKSQGHHEDYSKPLEVIWLCQLHHSEKHKLSHPKKGQNG